MEHWLGLVKRYGSKADCHDSAADWQEIARSLTLYLL
jgi:hypothetical protein